MIASINKTKELLQKYDLQAKKKFGQNFLIDSNVVKKIVACANIDKNTTVIEIGPGLGSMTELLCESAKKVICFEIDHDMDNILTNELDCNNLEIIEGDILKMDIRSIADTYNNGRPIKIVANLPYYITTPIVMELLESRAPIQSITVMVQREVAERMMATPGDRDCGAISLATQYYATVTLEANVPPNCFTPRPAVDSAVIRLDIRENPPVETDDEVLMFKLIRAAFGERRKTLANAIANSPELNYSKDMVTRIIMEAGMDPGIRGERLNLGEYARLADFFSKK